MVDFQCQTIMNFPEFSLIFLQKSIFFLSFLNFPEIFQKSLFFWVLQVFPGLSEPCPLSNPKIKNLQKTNTLRLEISSFYTCVPKIIITWCIVPEILCKTGRWADGRMDRKSDIYRWVPHIKKSRTVLETEKGQLLNFSFKILVYSIS